MDSVNTVLLLESTLQKTRLAIQETDCHHSDVKGCLFNSSTMKHAVNGEDVRQYQW
jgi:hypothetical protein